MKYLRIYTVIALCFIAWNSYERFVHCHSMSQYYLPIVLGIVWPADVYNKIEQQIQLGWHDPRMCR